MAMRLHVKRELVKSRELLRFFLRDKKCFFCKRPLVPRERKQLDGDGWAHKFPELPVIHHRDGNHGNQAESNKTLGHRTCHLSYHQTQRMLAKKRGVSR